MKKKILMVICLLLLTGCTANYDINIDENLNMQEKLSINENKKTFKENILQSFEINKYNVEIINCSEISEEECKSQLFDINPLGYLSEYRDKILLTRFGFSNPREINEFNDLYNYKNINNKEDFMINYTASNDVNKDNLLLINKIIKSNAINLDNENNLLSIKINNINKNILTGLDKYNITISSPYKVINSNADKINNHDNITTCVWNKNKNDNIDIDLTLDISKINKSKVEKSNNIMKIIFIVILIISIPLIIYFVKKLKQKNLNKDKI